MSKSAWHTKFRRVSKPERTAPDGSVFDSKGEMMRWATLRQWQLGGLVRNLKRQVSYPLVLPDGTPVLTKTGKTMIYTADFVYERVYCVGATNIERWEEVIEDYKGHMGPLEQIRIAIFEAIYKKKVLITGAASGCRTKKRPK